MKKVRVIYDPILRTPAQPVTVFDASLKELAEEMLVVMHKNVGMGLAANQVGVDKDLLVIEYRPAKDDPEAKPIGPMALCNARIIKTSQSKEMMVEGCLSIPGLELPVERPSGVTVTAQDLGGKPVLIKAKGLLARILQHEIDHLDGVLFTDRAKELKKLVHYTKARIVFFGSDAFSQPVLEALLKAGLNVAAVITETDKPAGRGGSLSAPLIKQYALEQNLAVFQPETKEEIVEILGQLQPQLVVLASYGKILPEAALTIPILGALNIHPSKLPQYRGATPLQTAILNGDSESAVTIMKMNAGVDTGEIVAQTPVAIDSTETFVSLRQKTAHVGASLLLNALPMYLSGQVKLASQDPKLASGTAKLTKEMGEINWNDSPIDIDRQIRALNPWPGTFTTLGGKRLKILEAILEGGKLTLELVQLEGKKSTPWSEFQHGYAEELKNSPWKGKIN